MIAMIFLFNHPILYFCVLILQYRRETVNFSRVIAQESPPVYFRMEASRMETLL